MFVYACVVYIYIFYFTFHLLIINQHLYEWNKFHITKLKNELYCWANKTNISLPFQGGIYFKGPHTSKKFLYEQNMRLSLKNVPTIFYLFFIGQRLTIIYILFLEVFCILLTLRVSTLKK